MTALMRESALPIDLYYERSLTVSVSHHDGLDRLTTGHDLSVYDSGRNDYEVARFSSCGLYVFVTVLDGE